MLMIKDDITLNDCKNCSSFPWKTDSRSATKETAWLLWYMKVYNRDTGSPCLPYTDPTYLSSKPTYRPRQGITSYFLH
jgi:hypothetical protein